jgi:hypothetical protein
MREFAANRRGASVVHFNCIAAIGCLDIVGCVCGNPWQIIDATN